MRLLRVRLLSCLHELGGNCWHTQGPRAWGPARGRCLGEHLLILYILYIQVFVFYLSFLYIPFTMNKNYSYFKMCMYESSSKQGNKIFITKWIQFFWMMLQWYRIHQQLRVASEVKSYEVNDSFHKKIKIRILYSLKPYLPNWVTEFISSFSGI